MKLFIGFLVGLFMITGCSSSKVKSDFDPKADFSTYKTYQWVSGIKIDRNDELSRHPTVLKVVQASVDKVLKEKGFQQVESGDPDFLVAVYLWYVLLDRLDIINEGKRRFYLGFS